MTLKQLSSQETNSNKTVIKNFLFITTDGIKIPHTELHGNDYIRQSIEYLYNSISIYSMFESMCKDVEKINEKYGIRKLMNENEPQRVIQSSYDPDKQSGG